MMTRACDILGEPARIGAMLNAKTLRSRVLRPGAALVLGLALLFGAAACAGASEEPIINSGSGNISLTPTPTAG